MLTDGKGCFYRAVISAATQKRCVVKVVEKTEQEPFWKGHLHLALAPTKNMDRMEWLAEKATEIGFDELTFLNAVSRNGRSSRLNGWRKSWCRP